MKQEFLDLYTRVNLDHRELVAKCVMLENMVTKLSSLDELADLAYVLRTLYDHVDESRKEIKRMQALVAKLFYVLWATDPTSPETVKTKWCTCSPDPKTQAAVPSPDKEPERYALVMRELGIPEDIIKLGIIRVGWEEFGELLTARSRAGLPTLPGIDLAKTYTEHRLTIRKRTDLPTGASSGSLNDSPVSVEEDGDNGEGQGGNKECSGSGNGSGSGEEESADNVPF